MHLQPSETQDDMIYVNEGISCSGGASAVKEPGHFEVRKSSSQARSSGVPDVAKGSPDPVA